MVRMIPRSKIVLLAAAVLQIILLFLADMGLAQEEVASAIRRYKEREFSTGYYEEYEASPQRRAPLVGVPGVKRGLFRYSPTAAKVRIRTRLGNSHQGIKFYENLRCEFCHVRETGDLHTVKANLTCRQCHGGEPIAGIRHYYSLMNPIRRYAVVCAKCHKQSSKSFATYLVHEPNPVALGTQRAFPLLFYGVWFMIFFAVGTFASLLPHTFLWGLREFLPMGRKQDDEV